MDAINCHKAYCIQSWNGNRWEQSTALGLDQGQWHGQSPKRSLRAVWTWSKCQCLVLVLWMSMVELAIFCRAVGVFIYRTFRCTGIAHQRLYFAWTTGAQFVSCTPGVVGPERCEHSNNPKNMTWYVYIDLHIAYIYTYTYTLYVYMYIHICFIHTVYIYM